MKFRKATLFFLLVIIGSAFFKETLAVDYTKSLQESPENWSQLNSFLKNNVKVEIAEDENFPLKITSAKYFFDEIVRPDWEKVKGGTNPMPQTDKKNYLAGETILVHWNLLDLGKNFTWGGGNVFVQIVRLAQDNVAEEEYAITGGNLNDEPNYFLLENFVNSALDFQIKLPENSKSGVYEIRLYPFSGESLVLSGRTDNYRAYIATRINVKGDLQKQETVRIDGTKLALNGREIGMKREMFFMEKEATDTISVPLENSGEVEREITVLKRIWKRPYGFKRPLFEEHETIKLAPKETKVVAMAITPDKKIEPALAFDLRFIDSKKGSILSGLSGPNQTLNETIEHGEAMLFPFFIKNVSGFAIMNSFVNFFPVKKGYRLEYLSEIMSADPLFHWSNNTRRSRIIKTKMLMGLYNSKGELVDEVGYEGPSWDRNLIFSKAIEAKEDYDYLKMVVSIKDDSGVEYDRAEIVYDSKTALEGERKKTADEKDEKLSSTEKKESFYENKKSLFWLILATTMFIVSSALVLFYIKREKNPDNQQK